LAFILIFIVGVFGALSSKGELFDVLDLLEELVDAKGALRELWVCTAYIPFIVLL